MRCIYHLVPPATWNALGAGPYRAPSLDTEGFIHCSNEDQVAAAANRFYAGAEQLLVLCIDAGRLNYPLRDEPAATGELFPHIYGPIDREAVVAVQPLERDPTGRWVFHPPII
ncbi:MAG TPA: DUF952 domain-containing protein [Gemmataceae bacterium]|nr:DUF952 domain-containing protein [Gemmataceae bacterium]